MMNEDDRNGVNANKIANQANIRENNDNVMSNRVQDC